MRPWWYPSDPDKGKNLETTYARFEASKEDAEKVTQIFNEHPFADHDIASVEVLLNPNMTQSFESELRALQYNSKSTAFSPGWRHMTDSDQREQVIRQWERRSEPYKDPQYPDVRILPTWHATTEENIDDLMKMGHRIFKTNKGFGSGIYSCLEPEKAFKDCKATSNKVLIMSWVASFSTFPVIYGDMPLLKDIANYGNYDSHFVPVSPMNPKDPDEVVYTPCPPGVKESNVKVYHYVVVFQHVAILPCYLVRLRQKSIPFGEQYSSATYTIEGQHPSEGGSEPSPSGSVKMDVAEYTTSVTDSQNFPPQPPQEEIPIRIEGKGDKSVEIENCVSNIANGSYLPVINQLGVIEDHRVDVLLGWIHKSFWFPNDDRKAKECFKRAYEKKTQFESNPNLDKFLLGLLLSFQGEATKEEKTRAFKLLEEVAKEISSANYLLGLLYEQEKNYLLAFSCFKEAYDRGHVRSYYHCGVYYIYGQGVKRDVSKGMEILDLAAKKSDVLALSDLGTIYEKGLHGFKVDVKKAIDYYKEASKLGYGVAQYNLGVIYEHGRPGIEKNLEKATENYSRASSQNIPRAQCNLARFYTEGIGGIPRDDEMAFELVEKAANLGYARAQYNLGLFYENGIGTPMNLNSAVHYFNEAIINPNPSQDPKAAENLRNWKVKLNSVKEKLNSLKEQFTIEGTHFDNSPDSRYDYYETKKEKIFLLSPHLELKEDEKLPIKEAIKIALGSDFSDSSWESYVPYWQNNFLKFQKNKENIRFDEYIAILVYTMENFHIYTKLNTTLTTNNREEEITNKWKYYLTYLLSALNKMKPVEIDILYRGVDNKNLIKEKKYEIGQTFTWYAFSSSSEDLQGAKRFIKNEKENTMFVIKKSYSGRRISKYSVFPKELEILFLPGCRFKVVNIDKEQNIIEVEQTDTEDTKLETIKFY